MNEWITKSELLQERGWTPEQCAGHERALSMPQVFRRVWQIRIGLVLSETMVYRRDLINEWLSNLKALGRHV
jgi:hypothetical protein